MASEFKAHKVRELSVDEIESRITELRESQFNLRFRNSMRQLDNALQVRTTRRDIAVLKTVLNEKLRAADGTKGEG
jgi:large subunit ribosomal protein L29